MGPARHSWQLPFKYLTDAKGLRQQSTGGAGGNNDDVMAGGGWDKGRK